MAVRGGCWAPTGSPVPTSAPTLHFSLFAVRLAGGPLLLLRLNAGVFTRGLLGPLQLTGQYLKYSLYHQVLLFLSQLSWTEFGQTLIICLTTAFNAFLKVNIEHDEYYFQQPNYHTTYLQLPFTRERECLLEMCLGLFHTPAKPLPESAREEWSEPVGGLQCHFCKSSLNCRCVT